MKLQILTLAILWILFSGCDPILGGPKDSGPTPSPVPSPTQTASPLPSPSPSPSPAPSPSPSPTQAPSPALLTAEVGTTPVNGTYVSATIPHGTGENITFTLTNSGGTTATSIAAASGGGLAAPFSFNGGAYPGIGGTCGTSLSAGSSCTLVLTFAPPAVASFTSSLTLAYSSGSNGLSWNVSLSGMGGANCSSLVTVASQSTLQTGSWVQNDNNNGFSASSGYATSFTLASAETLGSIGLYLYNHGASGLTGSISVAIESDSGLNSPSGTVLGANSGASLQVSALPSDMGAQRHNQTTATLASPLALSAGKYWIVLQAIGVSSSEQVTVWGASSGGDWLLQYYGYWYSVANSPSMAFSVQACQ